MDVDRLPIGLRTLSLVDHLRAGGTVPPIHVRMAGDGRFAILDGRHRLLAFRLLERRAILARWGTKDPDTMLGAWFAMLSRTGQLGVPA